METTSVSETPPSAQLSVVSPDEECLPGVEMWAGVPSLAMDGDCAEGDSGMGGDASGMGDDAGGVDGDADGNDEEESCDQLFDDSVVREADMEWDDETEVKVKQEREEEEEQEGR